ncbi:hypothetical protein M885DRAFT_615738 [Pelagophyceae sp. CCMP2097]|nr:hypothetical protein M885DRAFT_615738 [Pelagophyceae sp. CCMP2097]
MRARRVLGGARAYRHRAVRPCTRSCCRRCCSACWASRRSSSTRTETLNSQRCSSHSTRRLSNLPIQTPTTPRPTGRASSGTCSSTRGRARAHASWKAAASRGGCSSTTKRVSSLYVQSATLPARASAGRRTPTTANDVCAAPRPKTRRATPRPKTRQTTRPTPEARPRPPGAPHFEASSSRNDSATNKIIARRQRDDGTPELRPERPLASSVKHRQ